MSILLYAVLYHTVYNKNYVSSLKIDLVILAVWINGVISKILLDKQGVSTEKHYPVIMKLTFSCKINLYLISNSVTYEKCIFTFSLLHTNKTELLCHYFFVTVH